VAVTRADLPICLLLAAGCLWVLWLATRLPYGSEFAPGPGFAPTWLAGLGAIMALGLAIIAARRPGLPAAPPAEGGRAGLARVAAAVAGLAIMLLLIPRLGLLLALFAYLVFLTLAVQRLSIAASLLTGAGTIAFLYVVFQRALGVPFPSGPLGF
jgi:putative tricarboxylic transport membrane protein